MGDVGERTRRAGRATRPRGARRVLTAVAVVSITAGLGLLGYVGYQVWVLPPIAASSQVDAAQDQADAWSDPDDAEPTPSPDVSTAAPVDVPVAIEPTEEAAAVAVIRVPRFGADWQRLVRQGVDPVSVLNSVTAGVGHYEGTAMPGGIGNFAIAAHDVGWGSAFKDVVNLQVGDQVSVQTADGWYVYEFRNFEYVQPDAVSVLNPVPRRDDVAPEQRIITLTTCDPPYNTQERVIAYGTFVGFTPTTDGAPELRTAVV